MIQCQNREKMILNEVKGDILWRQREKIYDVLVVNRADRAA